MKRFSFPLERVLEYRRQLEEIEIGRLHLLIAERQRLLDQAGRLGREAQRVRTEPISRPILPALELRRGYEYAESLRRSRESTLARAEVADQQRRAQLQVVIEARRNTRLLELLRAKRLRRHARLADRQQETLAGELYLAALGREGLLRPSKP